MLIGIILEDSMYINSAYSSEERNFKNRILLLEKQNMLLTQKNALLQEKVNEISFLHNVLTNLIKTYDFEGTVEAILDMAIKITHSEVGFVLLGSQGCDNLEVIATSGELVPAVRHHLQNKSCAFKLCFLSKVVELKGSCAELKTLQKLDASLRSAIAVPLVTNGHVIGLLVLMHRHQGQDDHRIEYSESDRNSLLSFAGQAALILDNTRMKIEHGRRDVYLKSITALTSAIDAKDRYTQNHSRNVASYAVALGKALGLSEEELSNIHFGAILHDIGKIGVPENILNKPGRLSKDEFHSIKSHPTMGAKILEPIDFLKEAINVVLYHHERYDGSGYPEGLKGETIPYTARLVSIADAWDAMTSHRSYRPALAQEAAVSQLQEGSGSQFDPYMTQVFTDMIKKGKTQQLIT